MTQDQALQILKSGKNVFLTGEPGAGKTHTINRFCEYLHDTYKAVAITASTGIAATHINGKTIHSWAAIGVKTRITDKDIEGIMSRSYAVRQMVAADVLVIDEVSMLDGQTLNNIDRVLRHVRGTNMTGEPFGGMQVVLVGDFYQLPPVAKNKMAYQFAFESQAWKDLNPQICYLTEQHRQSEPEFLDILKGIRDGKVSPAHIKRLEAADNELGETTKLFTHNADVDSYNEAELGKIEAEEHIYKMQESGRDFLIEILKKNCLSPEELVLKVGALVMFTRNNFDQGYVNGTQGEIVRFSNGFPVVLTKSGQHIIANRAEWSIKHNDGVSAATIEQIPLRLAWAITVHKSQGMSLDSAEIDLSHAFEYGQGYVAISRVRSLKGLSLKGFNKKALMMHPKVVKVDAYFRKASENI